MYFFLCLLFICIVISAFFSTKIALALYLVHKFLVPVYALYIGGFKISSNYLALLILIIFLYKNRKSLQKLEYKPILYYLGYFFICFGFSFFSWEQTACISLIRSDCLSLVILPFALVNFAKFHPSEFVFVRKTLFFSLLVMVVYGVFLITMPGENPYALLLRTVVGGELSEEWLLEEGRIFGRISSTFFHPMMYACVLGFSIIYSIFLMKMSKKDKEKKIFAAFIILAIVSALTCGVRSVLLTLLMCFSYYCIVIRRIRLLAYFIVGLVILVGISFFNDAFYNYLISPFISESTINGSSQEMRATQISKSFDEIKDCFFFGHGYGWTTWYIEKKGNHPYLLAFESLFIKVLCEGGLFGLIAFGSLFFKLFRTSSRYGFITMTCRLLILLYLVYCTLTGDYLYSVYFIIFYCMVYSEKYVLNKKNEVVILKRKLIFDKKESFT